VSVPPPPLTWAVFLGRRIAMDSPLVDHDSLAPVLLQLTRQLGVIAEVLDRAVDPS
jgi:hypothetical protein